VPLHLIKLSVGSEDVDDLRQWHDKRLAETGRVFHRTRMMPRRREELPTSTICPETSLRCRPRCWLNCVNWDFSNARFDSASWPGHDRPRGVRVGRNPRKRGTIPEHRKKSSALWHFSLDKDRAPPYIDLAVGSGRRFLSRYDTIFEVLAASRRCLFGSCWL
jgi:hypothetical protein